MIPVMLELVEGTWQFTKGWYLPTSGMIQLGEGCVGYKQIPVLDAQNNLVGPEAVLPGDISIRVSYYRRHWWLPNKAVYSIMPSSVDDSNRWAVRLIGDGERIYRVSRKLGKPTIISARVSRVNDVVGDTIMIISNGDAIRLILGHYEKEAVLYCSGDRPVIVWMEEWYHRSGNLVRVDKL